MNYTRRPVRGFTLVELMVSLVAGLVVTIAVVGLARAATTTFFEAARMATVESTLRTASERLRQDLSRASYMSTGNIQLARDGAAGVPRAHRIAVTSPANAATGSRFAALNNLQGIQIFVGGSGATPVTTTAGSAGPLGLAVKNGLNPDAIVLTGNFTTDDSYQGMLIWGTGGAQAVQLNAAGDAAVRRLLGGVTQLAGLQAAFTPVPGSLYASRIVDSQGCQHYVVVTGVSIVAGNAVVQLANDAAGQPAVMPTNSTTCGANTGQVVTISPLQTVRWYIGPNVNAALDPVAAVEPATNKFNLYREFLSATAPPVAIPGTQQIIAEYAVDLKFGITVADAANALQVFDMDTAPANITLWTQTASTTAAAGPGPQRVRSVRFRLATRTAVPDRKDSIAFAPGAPYITRYCVENQPLTTCHNFARVRTVMSEVALMNQLGMSY
jgi:Tfp pilus assembly protein PilE